MQISRECGFCGIQGLCRNKQGEYTIAVEAVDMENDPVEAFCVHIRERAARSSTWGSAGS